MSLILPIESILFVSGEPLSVRALCRIFPDSTESEIREAVALLQEQCLSRGVRIYMKDDVVQMVSAPEYADRVNVLVQSSLTDALTPAALETLACIAYHEPITKEEIDDMRGVNSIFTLRTLMIRGLIEKKADKKYYITIDFLKKLGIAKVSDLPGYAEFQKDDSTNGE